MRLPSTNFHFSTHLESMIFLALFLESEQSPSVESTFQARRKWPGKLVLDTQVPLEAWAH
eukprot:11380474-Karenia_brevis.AAC.1